MCWLERKYKFKKTEYIKRIKEYWLDKMRWMNRSKFNEDLEEGLVHYHRIAILKRYIDVEGLFSL